MMKKPLITTVAITLGILTGCGNEETPVKESKAQINKSEVKNQQDSDTNEFVSTPIEDENIKVQLSKYEKYEDTIVGEVLKLSLDFENLTNEALTVSADQVSIDGKMLSDQLHVNFYEEVSSGKTAELNIEVYDIDSEEIEEVPDISDNLEFILEVNNEDSSISKEYSVTGNIK